MGWLHRELRVWRDQLLRRVGPKETPVWELALLINALVYSVAYIGLRASGWA